MDKIIEEPILLLAVILLISTVSLFIWLLTFKVSVKIKVKLGTIVFLGWLIPIVILLIFPLFFKPYTESNYGMVRHPNPPYPLSLLLIGFVSAIAVPIVTHRIASQTKLKPFVVLNLICAIVSSLAFACLWFVGVIIFSLY